MDFNDIYWHDAVVKNIVIDRNDPGVLDTIQFEINLPEGEQIKLLFKDVYWSNMILNFGIKAEETILDAFVSEENDEDFQDFYSKWNSLMDEVVLNCYVINLNSTGGKIKIIARGFNISPNIT